MKPAFFATLCTFAFTAFVSAAVAQDGHATVHVSYPQSAEPAWVYASDYVPAYPRRLAQEGTTGCAVFNLDIDEQGEITNSERVATSSGRRLGQESERLIKSWDWRAATPESPQAAQVQVRVDYCMAQGTADEVVQACAQQAQYSCS